MCFEWRWTNQGWRFAGLAALLLLTSCATSPTLMYYQLSTGREQVFTPPVLSGFEIRQIGIGPVTLPAYLDRPQIATRASVNQLTFADHQRWAEPLADNFSRVVAKNLTRLLGAERFQIFPWPGSRSIDWQFVIDVLAFENQADGTAVLEVQWMVLNGASEVLPLRRSRIESPAINPGQAGRVAALSQTVAELCQEIAASLVPLHGQQHVSP